MFFRPFCFAISLGLLSASALAATPSSPTSTAPGPNQAPVLMRPAVDGAAATEDQAAVAGTPASDPAAGEKVVNLPNASGDRRTQNTLNSLAKQAGWFPDVRIHVADGMVLIEGSAKSAEQVEWLAKTADRLPGVIAVINKTSLESPAVTDLSPAWAELRKIVEGAKKALPALVISLVLLMAFLFLGKYAFRVVEISWGRHINNPFLLSTVSRLSMIPIWALFIYLVLRTAGLQGLATTLIGGTGALSLVLGLAFNGIAQNYLSGILLAIRSPFTKGDEIQVGTFAGFVQSLNMRGTTIVDYDGNVLLIPNSIVITSVIRNRTVNSNVRVSFHITISYGDSIEQAQSIILDGLKAFPDILPKPGFFTNVDKISASGIDLGVYFWFDAKKANGDLIKARLIEKIKDDFHKAGLHIPDPARERIVRDGVRVSMEPLAEVQKREEAKPFPAPVETKHQDEELDKEASQEDLKSMTSNIRVLQKPGEKDLMDHE